MSSSKSIFMLMIKIYDIKVEPYFDQLPSVYYLIACLYALILDPLAIVQIVVFYYMYSSMKQSKVMLMSCDQKLSFVLLRYKAIVDICHKIRPLCDYLVSNPIISSQNLKEIFTSIVNGKSQNKNKTHWLVNTLKTH